MCNFSAFGILPDDPNGKRIPPGTRAVSFCAAPLQRKLLLQGLDSVPADGQDLGKPLHMEGKAVAGPGKNVLDEPQLHQAGLVNAEEAVGRQLGVILREGMGRGIGAAGGVDDAVPAGTVSLDIDYIFHVQQRGVTVNRDGYLRHRRSGRRRRRSGSKSKKTIFHAKYRTRVEINIFL